MGKQIHANNQRRCVYEQSCCVREHRGKHLIIHRYIDEDAPQNNALSSFVTCINELFELRDKLTSTSNVRSLSSRKMTRSRSFVSLEPRDLVVRLPSLRVRRCRSPIGVPGGSTAAAVLRGGHRPDAQSASSCSTTASRAAPPPPHHHQHHHHHYHHHHLLHPHRSSGGPGLQLERAHSRCVMALSTDPRIYCSTSTARPGKVLLHYYYYDDDDDA